MALSSISPQSKLNINLYLMFISINFCYSQPYISFFMQHFPRTITQKYVIKFLFRSGVIISSISYQQNSIGGNLQRGQSVNGYKEFMMSSVCQSEPFPERANKYLSQSAFFYFSTEIEGSILSQLIYECYINLLMQTAYSSPTKRTSFRSKTKLKDLGSAINEAKSAKTLPSYYVYLKQFSIDTSEDVIAFVKNFQPIHNQFIENLQNLKMYKNQLGCQFEQNWCDFMIFLKSIVFKVNKRAQKIIAEKDSKISQLLKMNRDLQNERQNWKQRMQKLQNLRQLESAQLTIADTELQIVSREMIDIYKILQTDMSKIVTYLTTLQKKKAEEDQIGSNDIFASLKTMSILFNNMETEQRSVGSTLETMRQMIKAMTRCTKATTGTQVDESQLETKTGSIFSKGTSSDMPFDKADGVCVNIDGKTNQNHLIDKLKQKQKIHGHQNFKMEKHAQKPWALTPTLLTFLENMSKDNEAGKVLPWQYTKQIIAEIYEERIKYETEMFAGNIGNGMLFDEFVVFYFLNKHRMRRLAEVKLLQLIISIKYYCKFWLKAETFCSMMDVMRYQPLFDNSDNFVYKFDYNTQNYFFIIYKKLVTYDTFVDDGMVYIPVKTVKKLIKAILFFSDEMSRSRLLAKLDKSSRSFNRIDYCDFDYALLLFIDEYFVVKKKNCNILNKAFSKKFDQIQGYFSIDQLVDIFTDLEHIYKSGSGFSQKYPIDSKLQIAKLYLYAVTSGKNGYEINSTNFIQSCQRFGFDSPFPFLHSCRKGNKMKEDQQLDDQIQTQAIHAEGQKQVQAHQIKVEPKSSELPEQSSAPPGINLKAQRIDVGVKLFSQHFSILRELKSYVDIFINTLKQQKNPEVLWKSFHQISIILTKGCQFMRYPLLGIKKQ